MLVHQLLKHTPPTSQVHETCSPPSSGGKSLVSEVLLVRQLLRHLSGHRMKRVFGRVINPPAVRALLIVPFITIVQEKTPQLQVASCWPS